MKRGFNESESKGPEYRLEISWLASDEGIQDSIFGGKIILSIFLLTQIGLYRKTTCKSDVQTTV